MTGAEYYSIICLFSSLFRCQTPLSGNTRGPTLQSQGKAEHGLYTTSLHRFFFSSDIEQHLEPTEDLVARYSIFTHKS